MSTDASAKPKATADTKPKSNDNLPEIELLSDKYAYSRGDIGIGDNAFDGTVGDGKGKAVNFYSKMPPNTPAQSPANNYEGNFYAVSDTIGYKDDTFSFADSQKVKLDTLRDAAKTVTSEGQEVAVKTVDNKTITFKASNIYSNNNPDNGNLKHIDFKRTDSEEAINLEQKMSKPIRILE
jgi:hypothetical protein